MIQVLVFVNRRFGIDQKSHDVGDLLRRQPVVQAETRHVGTGGEGIRVIDLVVNVLDVFFRIAADLAELLKTGADRAVGQFLLGQLVTGIAVAAVLLARRIVGEARTRPAGSGWMKPMWPPVPTAANFSPSFQSPISLPSTG